MCVKYQPFRAYTFNVVSLIRWPLFGNFVCKSMGSSSTDSSSTDSPAASSYILTSKSKSTHSFDLGLVAFDREQNYLQIDIKLSTIGIMVLE